MRITLLSALLSCLAAPATLAQTGLTSPAASDKATLANSAVARTGTNPPAAVDFPGWQFTPPPRPEFIDSVSGTVRYRLRIDGQGQVVAVRLLASTVSAAQERLCREALLASRLTRDTTKPLARSVGFYTFRFKVQ